MSSQVLNAEYWRWQKEAILLSCFVSNFISLWSKTSEGVHRHHLFSFVKFYCKMQFMFEFSSSQTKLMAEKIKWALQIFTFFMVVNENHCTVWLNEIIVFKSWVDLFISRKTEKPCFGCVVFHRYKKRKPKEGKEGNLAWMYVTPIGFQFLIELPNC